MQIKKSIYLYSIICVLFFSVPQLTNLQKGTTEVSTSSAISSSDVLETISDFFSSAGDAFVSFFNKLGLFLPDEASLPVEFVSQYPEMPTGCEITSLTTTLNYLGFDVSKEELADNYLAQGPIGSTNYNEAFIGSPYDDGSYGCWAPVIVDTAKKYLEDQDSSLKVKNLSGKSFTSLYKEIVAGNPVIVWGSMEIDTDIYDGPTWNIDGEELTWYSKEHCMVLIGYNKTDNTVTVSDPLNGIMTYDKDKFQKHYIQMEQQAVVIK